MDIEQALAFTDALVFAESKIHLSDLQQTMLRESWSLERHSYDQIADAYGYSPTYLKHDVGPKLWKLLSEVLGEKVTKTSFRTAIERRFRLEGEKFPVYADSEQALATPVNIPDNSVIEVYQDWGDAIDVDVFYGRQAELTQLQKWILDEQCRLITVLGMGGMGKTSLTVKLAQQLQSKFKWVIWRSLRNAPPVEEVLTDLLKFLSHQQERELPETLSGKISRLLHYLRSQPCLLIFDNVETILQDDHQTQSSYKEGYAAYGEIFRQVGEIRHQSCLLLTSRHQPPEVRLLTGTSSSVRSWALGGLQTTAAQELLRLKSNLQGTDDQWHQLIGGYAGNPLALKIIATTIQKFFNSKIINFLNQESLVFGDIRNLIHQQFERLSELEKTVVYWFAIYRDATTFSELQADIFPPISPPNLIEALESLEERSLIEKTKYTQFYLQPVIMEYVTDRLIEQVSQEISTGLIASVNLLFKTHALLKAQAKDYVREAQVGFILKPLLERLSIKLAGQETIANQLTQCLTQLRDKLIITTGYAGGNILNLLCQLQPCLNNYDFSDLIIRQADLQKVHLHNVNFTSADLNQCVFAETFGIVFAGVAFSPDGQLLATGDAEGGLRLWQVATGQLLLKYKGHLGWVWSVKFSADGQTLASCSSDKTIRLWDVNTGECRQILRGHTSSIWAIAFSPDGKIIVSGGDEPEIKLWNVNTGECVNIFTGHTGQILSLAFSPDGQTLASSSVDQTIRLWNLAGECRQVYKGHTNRIWSIAFSADSQTLASGSADHTIRLWSVSTGKCGHILHEHSDRVRSVAFSPDDQMLVSAGDDQTVRVWEIKSRQCLQVLRGHTNSVFAVAFNLDSQTLASGSTDQTVKLWDASTGRCFKTFQGYSNSVFSVSFNLDGQTLASGSTDQNIRLWDVNTGICQKILTGHSGWVTCVMFHPQGHLLASSSVDCTIRLWSVSSGQSLQILPGHTNWVQSVNFSPDGNLLVSGSDDKTIRLWDVNTGECLNTLSGHNSWIWCVSFSPNGKIIASSSEDQTIRLWEVNTGECLKVLAGHTRRVQSVAFSPDGQILSSASEDETIRLWDVNTGECLKVLAGHDNNVWSVAFSPEGSFVASSSLDQTVRLWDRQTGDCLKVLSVLTHSMRSSIAFSPPISSTGHNLIASGSQNGTIQIWDTQTGECWQTLHPDRPYNRTNITGTTGITTAQKEALKALGAFEF